MAYKLMGIAAHVIGDIYAHRSLVDLVNGNEIFSFEREFFSDWSAFYNKCTEDIPELMERKANQTCGVEYREISSYLKPLEVINIIIDFKNKKRIENHQPLIPKAVSLASLYEDSPGVKRLRYDSAATTIKSVLNKGAKYDFRSNTWNINCMKNRSILRY